MGKSTEYMSPQNSDLSKFPEIKRSPALGMKQTERCLGPPS